MAAPAQAAAARPSAELAASLPVSPPRVEQLGHRFEAGVAQRSACTPAAAVQPPEAAGPTPSAAPADPRALPDDLRASVESLSNLDLSNVRLHRNSPRPAELDALAYTQGNDIHVAPGQDRHLAHELWHVVQQRQGRVRVTTQVGGKGVNDDDHLEREADQMGARALQRMARPNPERLAGRPAPRLALATAQDAPIQGFWPFSDAHAPNAELGQRVAGLRHRLATASGHDRGDPAWFATQQNDLHHTEAEIHTWWRDHAHLATDQQRQQMAQHLHDLEDHHEGLTHEQLQHNHPLWLPAGTPLPEHVRANQVWGSVQANAGNLRITQGGAAFREQTLASVARLLEHQHGRDMLHELDTNPHGAAHAPIEIGADWSTAFALANREHQAGSWATPRVPDTQHHRRVDAHNAGPGVGSYVQIDRGGRESATGAHGTAVPMPYYLTLGHELGHALHNVQGTQAARPEDNPGFEALGHIEQTLWSNAEEHQNITAHENPLRTQHGLPLRSYHRPPEVVRATHMKNALRNRIDQVRADFPDEEGLHLLDPSEPLFYEQPGINQPAFYENADRRIGSLYRKRALTRALKVGGGVLATAGLLFGASKLLKR